MAEGQEYQEYQGYQETEQYQYYQQEEPDNKKRKKKKKEKVILQQYVRSLLNNMVLDYRVYVLTKSEKLMVRMVALVLGGLVGLVFYGGLFKSDGDITTMTRISDVVVFVLVGLIAGKFFMPMYVDKQLKKRQHMLRLQFRDMLESLMTSFSTGSNMLDSFNAALVDLKMQYEETDYIVVELQEIVGALMSNISIEHVLNFFGERSGLDDVVTFADVFSICYQKGGDMKYVVRQTYDVISDKMAINDEIDTKLTANKLQHNAMSLMPIIVVAMLKLTNEQFAESFASFKGVLVNTVAIAMFLGAYKYGNKIVDIKE